MFQLLKLAIPVLLKPFQVTGKESCRAFLFKLILHAKSRARETGMKIDDTLLRHVEFILKDSVLYDYVYCVIFEQLQTEDILFESAYEETIVELVGKAAANDAESPATINPVVVISLVTRIISFINTIKNR